MNSNIFGTVHRWLADLDRPNDAEPSEPSVGEVWQKASPEIDRALAVYAKMDNPSIPSRTWNPFGESKQTCQRDLDRIMDILLTVLGVCGAGEVRQRIKSLQDRIASSRERIAVSQENMMSAPSGSSQSFLDGLMISSQESLNATVENKTENIRQTMRQIEKLKSGFCARLLHIGLEVTPETADTFLLPVHDEIVSMAAVISNIGRITEQLQQLVETTRESPAHTKRYYGVYVLLVLAVDRIQNHYITEIDQVYIPKLQRSEKSANEIREHAYAEIARGALREQLLGNVEANKRTIHACRMMNEMLLSHRRAIVDENKKVKVLIGTAVNSYRTVKLSLDVAELIGACESAFRALRELRIPPLRTFQNVHLNEELQKLANQIVLKG